MFIGSALCFLVAIILFIYYRKEKHINQPTFEAYRIHKKQTKRKGLFHKFLFVYRQKINEYKLDEEVRKILKDDY